jgi:hypothetical protein
MHNILSPFIVALNYRNKRNKENLIILRERLVFLVAVDMGILFIVMSFSKKLMSTKSPITK